MVASKVVSKVVFRGKDKKETKLSEIEREGGMGESKCKKYFELGAQTTKS